MTEDIAEQKKEIEAPQKTEEPKQEKKRFDLKIKGSNKKETLENVSFLIIVISAFMISAGIGFGSFIQGTVFIAVFGAFLVMVGIIAYIVSQFLGEANG